MKINLILFFFLLSFLPVFGDSLLYERSNHCYSQKGDCVLCMDIYRRVDVIEKSPCMLFLFGGGFMVGNKRDARYLDYFEHLISEGVVVVAIDYRLGMVGVQNEPWRYPDAFENSIRMGVEDLFDAILYLLETADYLQIDCSKLMVSGSSAGAIIALEADYILRNNCNEFSNSPDDFEFACVISFSGGLYLLCADWDSMEQSAPTLLFHGGRDRIVTPDSIELFSDGFYGSNSLVEKFKENNSEYIYCFYPNYGHEVSYMSMCLEDKLISEFLHRYVLSSGSEELGLLNDE